LAISRLRQAPKFMIFVQVNVPRVRSAMSLTKILQVVEATECANNAVQNIQNMEK